MALRMGEPGRAFRLRPGSRTDRRLGNGQSRLSDGYAGRSVAVGVVVGAKCPGPVG
jgi:hypothetical protein